MKTSISTKASKNSHKAVRTNRNFSKLTLVITLLMLMIGQVSWGQTTYKLVTSTSNLVAGAKYIIVSTQSNSTTAKAISVQAGNNRPQSTASVTVASGLITTSPATAIDETAKTYELTLGGSSGAWSLYDPLYGYLYAASSSSNYLRSAVTVASWTITFSSNAAILTCTTGGYTKNVLQYNSGSSIYSCYTSGQTSPFLYQAVPTITSFTPTSGPSGTSVVITGTYLTGASIVTIGGTAVTSFTVDSPTQITATVASGTTGTIAVTVGNSTVTSAGTFTFASTPDIALSDNGTQVASANVTAGTSNHILHKFQLGVTTANASLTGLTCTTAGTYASADLTNLKCWYSADNSFATSGDNVLLSTLTTPGTAGAKTFSSFTAQAINTGNTGYFFITADIASGATPTNTISVDAITNLTLSGNKTGSTTAGGIQTIVAPTSPTITVGSISAFGNQCVNTTSSELTYNVSGANLTANIGITAPTGFEISTTSGSGFGSSVTLTQSGGSVASTPIYVRFIPTLAQPYSENIAHTSTGATSQDVAVSGTGTSPLTPSVGIAVTSGSNPTCPGTSVTFTATPTNGGTPSYQWKKDGSNVGTNSATYTDAGSVAGSITCVMTSSLTCVSSSTGTSGAISLTQSVPNATSPAATAGNGQVSVSWSNPACYDEIMIVAAPASNNGTPTGDGTAYTANVAYTSGTALGNGYVAFKGTSSPQTVTGLTNGSTYYFKIFTRKGSVWSAGVEVSATPVAGPCASETFSNSSLTGSYATDNFVGDNGVTWSYVNSRDVSTYGITGKGIMFEGTTAAKLTSSSVSGGIGSFTCSLKKAFTGSGNRQVELFVNGVSKGTSIAWDNTTVQTFTVNDINISGDVVIEIKNKLTKQVIIDDISWTCYASCTPPTAPTTTGGSVCNSGTVSLSASGAVSGEVYKWYSAATAGTLLKTSTDYNDNTYTTASISANTTYYVTRYVSATSCESATRAADTATVVSSTTSIAPATAQNIIVSTNGSTLTVTEGSAATSRVWKYGTTSGTYSTSTGTTTTTFTPNFASAGTYYVVCESTYPAPCGVVTSTEVIINVASNTITTSAITGSTFCAGSAVSVPYTIGGTYTSGNVFTAQLSNSSGSFASPTNIGTATSTAAGTISASIPAGTTTGSGYRIRVISSTPAITGLDNGTNLTINATVIPSVSIAITTGANPSCAGASVTFTATPTNGGATPTYQWKVGSTVVGTNSATFTTTTLANGNVVTCVMTSNAACPSPTTATSTGITMTVNAVPSTPTAGSNSPICSGATLNLTSNATGTIAWTGPNSFTASTQNPSISSATTAATGTYNVKSTVNGCASLAGTIAVTINSTPVISSGLTASGTTSTAFSYTITASSTPTSYAASTLPAGFSLNTSTGVISGNPTTAGTTNVTISATNACGTSTSATLVITISSFTYAAGDYRTTADYTKFANNNNAGATNNWEYFNGSTWGVCPSDKAPANAATTPTRIIINKTGVEAGGTTSKTYNDIIIQDGGELLIVDDIATPTVNVINADKKIEVLSGGKLYIQGDIKMPADGALIVRSGGEMIIDQASMRNDHKMWDGVESFEAGSTVTIKNWDFGGTATYVGLINISNTIANNSNGYKFGNLIVDANTNSDWAWCGGSYNEIINLAYNDVTVNNAGTGYIGGITNKTAALGYRINGNLTINSGNFNFSATYSADPFQHQAYINGNFSFNSSGNLYLHRNANKIASSMVASQQSFVQFKGNIYVNPAATFTNEKATDNSTMYIDINGSGISASPQLIDIGVATGMTGINTNIKNNTFVKLKSHNWIFNGITGLTTALTVETGSSLHFGWADNGTTPLIITTPATPVGTNTFTTQTGTTLYMTHPEGLDNTATAKGNVQKLTQTYNQVANFWYVGKADQVTGNGITTASTNKLIGLDMLDGTKTTTLTNAIITTGKLILKTGVLSSTASNLFTIGAGGSVHTDFAGTNGAAGSATSFVDGPIMKIGNTAFTFPTGDVVSGAKWARIGISAPSNASTEYTAEYFGTGYGDNSVVQTPFAIDHVSTKEYWNLSQSANYDVSVKLFWEDATFSDITTCSSTDLRIAHYNGTDWELNIDEATVNCGSSGNITTSSVQPSFSPFTFAFKTNQTLPIELLTFNAVRDGKNVNVDWATASETNNNFFTVERSKDANNFEFVSNYPGAGNSSDLLHYNLTDFAPYSQKSYYRLKQTDYDGKYSFSSIVAVDEINDGQNSTITIGKVQNSIQIGIENGLNADYLVRIIDVFGRVLYQEKYNSPSDKIIIYMDDSKYARGVYTVAVTSGTTIKTNKIIW